MNDKREARTRLKERLATLPLARRKEAAKEVLALVPLLPPLVLSFSSTATEIDLSSLNSHLMEAGRLILPRIEGDSLAFFRPSSFTLHPFGFWEPDPTSSERVDPKHIALALVPGLGFDALYRRLGYGKGYYDRLFSSHPMERWGIGFKEQWEKALPCEEHDVPLTALHLF